MKRKKKKCKDKSVKITGIDITEDTLTSRGGLSLFVRYIDAIGVMSTITLFFGSIRKNCKGNGIEEIFKQLLCNFVDGTSRHLVHYDRIQEDAGYAGVIESTPAALMSSHTKQGTPQGGVISPLLANIFLHHIVDVFVHEWRKTQAKGEIYIVRYADDFVIGCEHKEDADALLEAIDERLCEYGLTLNRDKTRLIRFGRYWQDTTTTTVCVATLQHWRVSGMRQEIYGLMR